MRLGNWFFVNTAHLTCAYAFSYTRNIKRPKNITFEPYLVLQTIDGIYLHVRGKRALWSLLDSMFPHDRLPRTAVNDDLKKHNPREVINGLLSDPDAWPYLRLHVTDNGYYDQRAELVEGTFVLSASSNASDSDVCTILSQIEADYPESYISPHTYNTKTTLRTVPTLFIPLESNRRYKVAVVDCDGSGLYRVFSVVESEHGDCFRPRKQSKHKGEDIVVILNQISSRLKELDNIRRFGRFDLPSMKSLDAGMRHYERDELEFRRFISLPEYPDYISFVNSFN